MSKLSQRVQELTSCLLKLKLQLVTAESCTGGMAASLLTEIPDSSKWFERGFVTYSNLSKQEMLGVPIDLLNQHGAVSEPVASAMAVGALEHSVSQVAMAITGIAGPGGGSVLKPVGTVCFAWAGDEIPVQCETVLFSGTREVVREKACYHAFTGCIDRIKNNYSMVTYKPIK